MKKQGWLTGWFHDSITKVWAGGVLQRTRLVMSGILLIVSLSSMVLAFLYPWTSTYLNGFCISFSCLNMMLIFWPTIYGRSFGLIHYRHTRLHVEDGTALADAVYSNGTWYDYKMKPEVKDWCRATLGGWYGTVPRIDPHHGRSINREFWFSNPDDAFAFRIRWL